MSLVALQSVCRIVMGQAPPGTSYNSEGRGLPLLAGAADLGEVYPRPKKHTSEPTQIVEAGEIILCIRATIGDRNWADRTYCLGRGVAGLSPDTGRLDVRYLWHWLGAASGALNGAARGSTFRQVDKASIGRLQIPLPPLPEQRRIAALLDKADAIRRKRQQAIHLADNLLRSAFLDMFGDPVANPKGWPLSRLDEVATVVSGVTKGRKLDPTRVLSVPYMRVANVQDGHLLLDDIKEIEALPEEVVRYRLETGDVLLTEGGDPDKLGRGAVWRGGIDSCIHQNHIFRVRANASKLLPDFLSAQLGSARGKRYFARAAKQTTGIASINMTQLSAFPALLPPVAAQTAYGAIVKRFRELEHHLAERQTACDRLCESLAHAAFHGRS
jgi:type I restriction enzyme S subunit